MFGTFILLTLTAFVFSLRRESFAGSYFRLCLLIGVFSAFFYTIIRFEEATFDSFSAVAVGGFIMSSIAIGVINPPHFSGTREGVRPEADNNLS